MLAVTSLGTNIRKREPQKGVTGIDSREMGDVIKPSSVKCLC
jgi:hypothetical protein